MATEYAESRIAASAAADAVVFVDTNTAALTALAAMNTLAELNAIISDATLIDTGDSRLSDARTPTAHAASHVNGTDDIQSATAAQKGLMTAAYASKLDGIETGADVTDTANVTAAGALMDSEVASLSGIKTLSVPDSTTISSFGASLTDDANASAARTTLELSAAKTGQIVVTFDGGGSALTTGIKADVKLPYAVTITAAELVADQTGSLVVDVWYDSYANFPPTDADSITASAPPTLSSAVKSVDSTLTGWTTSLAAGGYLRFNVESIATITRATLTLTITK